MTGLISLEFENGWLMKLNDSLFSEKRKMKKKKLNDMYELEFVSI